MPVESCSNGLKDKTIRLFRAKFGRSPKWLVAAPGRVNLIGEHTDYNGGWVLPMAIDRYTVIAADHGLDMQTGRCLRIHSDLMDSTASITYGEDQVPNASDWSSYVRGVLHECLTRDRDPGSLDAVIHSSVPSGGGLSSSAALEVALATLIEEATHHPFDATEKALLCRQAEHQYANMPCGVMDQFVSVMAQEGHALLIDCHTQTTRNVRFKQAPNVVIVDTNVKHELNNSEYPQRQSQCFDAARQLGVDSLRDATMDALESLRPEMDPLVYGRARHVVTENARTLAAAEAMERMQWTEVGSLMYESHRSLRDDFDVSCLELNVLVDLAEQLGIDNGVLGSRMTGGGFGGCTVTLVSRDATDIVIQEIAAKYKERVGIEATVFVTSPSRGAHVL